MNCKECRSEDMYDDNHCWDCADFDNETKQEPGKTTCPHCNKAYSNQYGAYTRHFVACKD